jgi:hypothetical protein
LAAHPAMVYPKAAGPLADCQFVLNNPGEIARRNAKRPLTTQFWGH